jgi:hypothetical protein
MGEEYMNAFEDVAVVEDEVKSEEVVPLMTDPGWSDYVMKQFTEDELFEGNPKTEGLRRVVELLLGPIVSSRVHTVSTLTVENQFRATVEHEVIIGFYKEVGGDRVFSEVADVFAGNTDDLFARHPTATASTRAEGRALRKALKLKNVVSAEEVTSKGVEEAGMTGLITSVQIKVIDLFCSRNDINVVDFINSGKLKYKNIEQVSFTSAQAMLKRLNEYQQDNSMIPMNLKGYEKNWRNQC